MGEKIRDLHSVRIGSGEFMLELNEGYTEAEGRLIHLQNRHFRFAINERGFLELASSVLRACKEMQYYKQKGWKEGRSAHTIGKNAVTPKSNAVLGRAVRAFDGAEIEYRFIEGGDRFLTFIIEPDSRRRLEDLIRSDRSMVRYEHPFGTLFGYQFLYQMTPFQLFELDHIYVEIYFQLPCMSLTPNMWIPLDKMIQKRVWDECEKRDGIKYLDSICLYIYRLCSAIFKNRKISDQDKEIFEKHTDVLQKPEFRKCLEMVFFNYSGHLIEALQKKEYLDIIPGYFTFDQY